MKTAKVIPNHKSADPSLNGFNQLMKCLTSNSILYNHQYGCRPKHSTTHQIIHLLNHCASSSSKSDPELTLAVLCDLSKAFDIIDRKIVLKKM